MPRNRDTEYRDYRRRQLAEQVPGVAAVLFFVSVLFVVFLGLLAPPRLYDQRWNLPLLILAPGLGWLAAKLFPVWNQRHPYVLPILMDAAYTLGIVTALFARSTPTSGTALFVTVKMLSSSMLVPWHPAVQGLSAAITLGLYWTLAVATGRVVPGSADLAHQLTGPLFGALISVIASLRAEALRRNVFDETKEREEQARINAQFAGIMSHELRNLLSAILGYNEILREELGDLASAEVREALERQALVARQSLEVIGVTLELSRGGVPTSRSEEPLDPLRILDELQSEYSLRALPQNVVLRWDLSPDLPSISADPVKLKMILRNLIDNGLKFTPQGEVCVRVRPRLDELIFEVCDTGIGIPAEKQPFIFEPFQQAHDESRGRGGVGLGLYVASRLAEMLDGSLSVQSEVGKGSCFELRIPLSPSTPAGEASA